MEGPDALEALIGQLEGFSGAGRCVGNRRSCRHGFPNTSRLQLDDNASPAVSPGRGCGHLPPARTSAAPRRCGRRRLRCCRAGTCVWASLSPSAEAAQPSAKARAVADCIREHGASFSTSWSRARICLLHRSKRRWPSWWRWGSSIRTASPGCAPCWCQQTNRSRRRRRPIFGMADAAAGPWRGAARRGRQMRSSSTSPARCCAATASCSGGCSNAKRRGCRRGGNCCASTAGSKPAARSAAAALSRALPASSSRCPTRSDCCERSPAQAGLRHLRVAVGRRPAQPCRHPLTPGSELAGLMGNRILYRDGLPVALYSGGEVQVLETLDPAGQWQARKALLRSAAPPRPPRPRLRRPRPRNDTIRIIAAVLPASAVWALGPLHLSSSRRRPGPSPLMPARRQWVRFYGLRREDK